MIIERKIDEFDALTSLLPGAEISLRGSFIEYVDELDDDGNVIGQNVANVDYNGVLPSKEEIEAEVTRLQAEYDSKQYQRLRQPEYPPLADLADALYWQAQGDESKMTAYLAAVEAVKQKYPKGV